MKESLRTAVRGPVSFTYDAVAISHILVGGMSTRDRRDAVLAGFGAGDPLVPVVS